MIHIATFTEGKMPVEITDSNELGYDVLFAEELLHEHWVEVAKNKQIMRLKPDRAKYEMLEKAGKLFCLTARVDGQLVGYSVNLIDNHLHYADLLYANNDVLFVTQAHRSSRIGLQLIKATEDAAIRRGAQLMLWHAKEDTAMHKLMPRLGYAVQDIIFSKEL